MSCVSTNIIARSMEINIRRIRRTIIRRVAQTPQERSDQDDTIRWVSNKSFDFFYFFFVYEN